MKSASVFSYPEASDSKITAEYFPDFSSSQISLYWFHVAYTMTMMKGKMPTKT